MYERMCVYEQTRLVSIYRRVAAAAAAAADIVVVNAAKRQSEKNSVTRINDGVVKFPYVREIHGGYFDFQRLSYRAVFDAPNLFGQKRRWSGRLAIVGYRWSERSPFYFFFLISQPTNY